MGDGGRTWRFRTFGLLSIKPSADYLDTEELNVMQIHLKSRGRREKEQVPSATGFVSPPPPPTTSPPHPLPLPVKDSAALAANASVN